MQRTPNKFLLYFLAVLFFAYWIITIIMDTPDNVVRQKIAKLFPLYTVLFPHSWRLFAPPQTFDNRLYVILKDTNDVHRDTLEILENIAHRKQIKAPFYQYENIIDNIINPSVNRIKNIFLDHKMEWMTSLPGQPDSFYMHKAVSDMVSDPRYISQLKVIKSYCIGQAWKNGIDTTAKEYKLAFAEKQIPPFPERNNKNYVRTERVIFETFFKNVSE